MLLFLMPTVAVAQIGVPPALGFHWYSLEGVANTETLISPAFAIRRIARVEVNAVNGATVTVDGDLDDVIAGSCHIEVQNGSFGGLVCKVVGVDGQNLQLESSVDGLVSEGTVVGIHTYWTLTELFEFSSGTIGSGATPEESDLVTVIDPASQVATSYYQKENEGWREVGNEAAGDRGDVGIPFYEGFYFRRRSAERLNIVVHGRTPLWPQRYQMIYPGRNLIGVSVAGTSDDAKDYFFAPGTTEFSVHGGTSATDADVVALSGLAGLMPRYYYHLTEGWKVIGAQTLGDRSLASAADYHRIGPKSFLKVLSVDFGSVVPEWSIAAVQRAEVSIGTLTVESSDDLAGPGGEIVGPHGEFVGPGGEIDRPSGDGSDSFFGQQPVWPTPGGGSLAGPSPGGLFGDSPSSSSHVKPVEFEHELVSQAGRFQIRFQWESEVGRRYALQYRRGSRNDWLPLSETQEARSVSGDAVAEITTNTGEFRVVEIVNLTPGS